MGGSDAGAAAGFKLVSVAMSVWAGRELLAGRWRRGHGDGPGPGPGRGERDGAAPRKPPEEAVAARGPLAAPERSSLLQVRAHLWLGALPRRYRLSPGVFQRRLG